MSAPQLTKQHLDGMGVVKLKRAKGDRWHLATDDILPGEVMTYCNKTLSAMEVHWWTGGQIFYAVSSEPWFPENICPACEKEYWEA